MIAALGSAADLALSESQERQALCRAYRERLLAGIAPLDPVIHGGPALSVPNIVNLSIVVGSRFAGARGALAAVFGLVGAPVALVIVLGALYGRFGEVGRLHGAITGLGAAAAGLAAAAARNPRRRGSTPRRAHQKRSWFSSFSFLRPAGESCRNKRNT
jgi:hypothetical protein